MENQIIHQFLRKPGEEVYFSLREFKDKRYLDLRIFFQPKEGGEMRPTRKGITLELGLLPELKKGITACEKKILMLRS